MDSAPPSLMASLVPLGDEAVLVRFAETLSEPANRAAIAFAARLEADPPEGAEEIVPGLVSVLVRMRRGTAFRRLCGEIGLRMGEAAPVAPGAAHEIAINFDGPDLDEVAEMLSLSRADFVAQHNAEPLRVLATGFAPGFVYCGFHPAALLVPRRRAVRPLVPAGTVLFAAGQTAIAATPIRTGWHVLGRTVFQNFDPLAVPPTRLMAGDIVRFTVAA